MKAFLSWFVTCLLVLLASLVFRCVTEGKPPLTAAVPGALFFATVGLVAYISRARE